MNEAFPPDFEENDRLRSDFIRQLTLRQLARVTSPSCGHAEKPTAIPRTLVRFWHDQSSVPSDVRVCMDSWNGLRDIGFDLQTYGDESAAAYIAERYGRRELAAFAACRHPAMRSDYFRLCFVLADGGLYVDADDVLVGNGWNEIFRNARLKLQPLCYDVTAGGMVMASELQRSDLPTAGRIFYVNNNPLAAPPGHPILRRALARATNRLLAHGPNPEIQSTTGPGNLTAALAAHAYSSPTPDFDFLFDWEETAEPCWDLAYRNDARNWRNMDHC